MSDNVLTAEMLEGELAEYAESVTRQASRWTPELDALLIQAREKHGLTWEKLDVWWKAKFGWGSDKSLNKRYKELKANEVAK